MRFEALGLANFRSHPRAHRVEGGVHARELVVPVLGRVVQRLVHRPLDVRKGEWCKVGFCAKLPPAEDEIRGAPHVVEALLPGCPRGKGLEMLKGGF